MDILSSLCHFLEILAIIYFAMWGLGILASAITTVVVLYLIYRWARTFGKTPK